MKNIREKNAAWWQKTLSNNSFDLSGKGNTDGNYRPLCGRAIHEFITNNLSDTTKQAINRAGYLNVKECIQEMFEDHPDGLTKRKLRKQMLEHNVPLTRLDTHLLFKALEHPTTGLVTKGDFTMFIEDPGHYKISKSKKGAGVHTGWIVEEVEEEEGFGLSKMDNQYMELITDLYEHIKEDQVDVAGELRKLDTNHDGIITFDNFKKFNKNIHSPLTTLEQKSLFDKLKEILGGNVTIPDLSKSLNR